MDQEQLLDRRKAYSSANTTRPLPKMTMLDEQNTQATQGLNNEQVDIQVTTTVAGSNFEQTSKKVRNGSVVNVQSMISRAHKGQGHSQSSPKTNHTQAITHIPKNMEIKYKKDMQQLKFYQTLNNYTNQQKNH